MTTGMDDGAPPGGDESADAAGLEHSYSEGLALSNWSAIRARSGASPWMRAELARLRAAFPEFSFRIWPGWRGLTFEAWRDPGIGGAYAVITRDAMEPWRELEQSQGGLRPVADTRGNEAR